MLTSLTVMLETHAFVLSLPSPPMLIPWPGPQFTLCMYMLLQPVWMETQSSPASNKPKITLATFCLQRCDSSILLLMQKVYSICVETVLRGRDGQAVDHDSLTVVELEMALRAVDDSDTSYCDIETTIESQCLQEFNLWHPIQLHTVLLERMQVLKCFLNAENNVNQWTAVQNVWR